MTTTSIVSSSTEDTPKKAPKKLSEIQLLQKRIETLETAFIKVATMSGHGNQLKDFGYKMWKPQPKDMSQY